MDKNEMTVREFARNFGYSEGYTRRLIKEEKIKARKVTRGWMIDLESAYQYTLYNRT